eukprot:TRINITY_DN28925_c0_g1_i1.p1 TRINITY_DN28925_c0_g1~~TRINITY_DN28925_c0_g1_i1.p1  ORF type:complete len:221 (+),score=69.72 TRINITY_DN28925_c0_g1_i1:59-721(+)
MFLKGLGQTMTAAAVLDAEFSLMNPLQLRKAGAIVGNMKDAGYDNKQINHICRALFGDHSDEDMQCAWEVFDHKGVGELDVDEFKEVLPLMGETVPPEEVAQLFDDVDENGSGRLEYPEFVKLIKAMNPKKEGSAAEVEEPTEPVAEAEAEGAEAEPRAPPECDPPPSPIYEVQDLRTTKVFGVQLKVLCFRSRQVRGVPSMLEECGKLIRKHVHNQPVS